MKRNPTIAEIIHRAADEFLSDGYGKARVYSCNAIRDSCYSFSKEIGDKEYKWFYFTLDRIMTGLTEMGLNTGDANLFYDCDKPQEVRYAWLKFAAMIAEEQGV